MFDTNTNNKNLLVIITGTLCWAYVLTLNVRVIPLTLLFMLFTLMGFVLLKVFYDKRLQFGLNVIGFSFGIFLVAFSAVAIPSLIFHVSYKTFFAAQLSVVISLLFCSVFYIFKKKNSRVVQGIEEFGNVNNRREYKIEETKAPVLVFLIIVVIDILAGALLFRSNKFIYEGFNQKVFFLLIIINLLVSAYFAFKYREKAEIPHIQHSEIVMTTLMIMMIILLTLTSYLAICNLYLDADDCTYISATLNFKKSTQLNVYEPSLGSQLRQFPGSLIILWELFMSFVSDLSFIPPVELYQYFLYPVLYLIVISSCYFLFCEVFQNRQDALLSTVLYLIYNIKSVDYHKSISKFFMLRLHQPKSILNFILYPLAIAVLIRYIREKKIKDLVVFSLFLSVAYAIHPFALFMFFLTAVAILLFYAPHDFSWESLKKYSLLAIPFSTIGLIALYQNSLINQIDVGHVVSTNDFINRNALFYQSSTKLLIVVLLPLLIYFCRDRMVFSYLFGTSIIIGFVCFCNPVYVFLLNILGQMTWRVIEFVIPQSLILIWILILWKNYLVHGLATIRSFGGNRTLCSMIAVFMTFFLMVGYQYGSSSLWATKNLNRISNHSRIEKGVRQVLEVISEHKTEQKMENITVMLPLEIAWLAPIYIQNLKTPVSRLRLVYGYYQQDNRMEEGLKIIENYIRFYDGTLTKGGWQAFKDKFYFDIIVNNITGGKNGFFLEHVMKEYRKIFSNEKYAIFAKKEI